MSVWVCVFTLKAKRPEVNINLIANIRFPFSHKKKKKVVQSRKGYRSGSGHSKFLHHHIPPTLFSMTISSPKSKVLLRQMWRLASAIRPEMRGQQSSHNYSLTSLTTSEEMHLICHPPHFEQSWGHPNSLCPLLIHSPSRRDTLRFSPFRSKRSSQRTLSANTSKPGRRTTPQPRSLLLPRDPIAHPITIKPFGIQLKSINQSVWSLNPVAPHSRERLSA